MARPFLALGAILGGSSVAAGAFATHALRGSLTGRSLEIFETGARYQMYHALVLIAIALLIHQAQSVQPRPDGSAQGTVQESAQETTQGSTQQSPQPLFPLKLLKASGTAMALGTLLFSGSLYSLSLTGVARWGAVAPLGGLCLLLGWGLLAIAALRPTKNPSQ